MKTLRVFLLGFWEFRRDFTSNPGEHLIEAYDAGRDLAHRLTLRYWDQSH